MNSIADGQTSQDSPQELPASPTLNSQPSTLDSPAIDRQLGLQNQIRWQRGLPPTPPEDPLPLDPRFWVPNPLIPPPYFRATRQPTGHRITATGPNSYTYEPAYDVDPPTEAVSPAATTPAGERELLTLAVDAFRSGRYEETLEHLDRVEGLRPRHGPAGLLRAQAYLALGDYRAAAESLRHALGLLAADQWGLVVENFADYYPDPARFADHLQRLADYSRLHPNDADAHLLLGYHCGFLGHRGLAATELAKAAELAPADALIQRLVTRFSKLPPPPPEPVQSPAGRRAF